MHEDFMNLNDKTKKECKEMQAKYLQLYEDKKRSEKNFEMEILRYKNVN
jgi:hypothetical protein